MFVCTDDNTTSSSKEQCHPSEANSFLANLEHVHILWNPVVYYRTYASQPLVCIPSRVNSLHTVTSYLILSFRLVDTKRLKIILK
jgi:hypothetical protein